MVWWNAYAAFPSGIRIHAYNEAARTDTAVTPRPGRTRNVRCRGSIAAIEAIVRYRYRAVDP
jgi:hypothetical protein